MLHSPIFHLALSFLAATYIAYKKIWPFLIAHLKNYSLKINDALLDLEKEQKQTLEALYRVKKEAELVDGKIHALYQEGQQKTEKLKESYNASMASIVLEEREHAKKVMEKLQKKRVKAFYDFATDKIHENLIIWAKSEVTSAALQKGVLSNQLSILKAGLRK